MMTDLSKLPLNLRTVLQIGQKPEAESLTNLPNKELIRSSWQLQGLKLFKVKFYNAAA